jgi:hypothetical protein
MAKQKKTRTTTIYKTLHRKLKIEKHEPTKPKGELRKDKQFLLR